jgi:hypothetical protein
MSDEIKRNPENAALSNDDSGDAAEETAAPKTNAAAAGVTPAGKGGTNPLHNATADESTERSTE